MYRVRKRHISYLGQKLNFLHSAHVVFGWMHGTKLPGQVVRHLI